MAKADREAAARIGGMHYAIRQIKEKGMEEFEKEVAWRGSANFGLQLSSQEAMNTYKQVYIHVRMCAIITLYDEFDFTPEEIERFNNRYNDKILGLNESYVNWKDYEDILHNEIGVGRIDFEK